MSSCSENFKEKVLTTYTLLDVCGMWVICSLALQTSLCLIYFAGITQRITFNLWTWLVIGTGTFFAIREEGKMEPLLYILLVFILSICSLLYCMQYLSKDTRRDREERGRQT